MFCSLPLCASKAIQLVSLGLQCMKTPHQNFVLPKLEKNLTKSIWPGNIYEHENEAFNADPLNKWGILDIKGLVSVDCLHNTSFNLRKDEGKNEMMSNCSSHDIQKFKPRLARTWYTSPFTEHTPQGLNTYKDFIIAVLKISTSAKYISFSVGGRHHWWWLWNTQRG